MRLTSGLILAVTGAINLSAAHPLLSSRQASCNKYRLSLSGGTGGYPQIITPTIALPGSTYNPSQNTGPIAVEQQARWGWWIYDPSSQTFTATGWPIQEGVTLRRDSSNSRGALLWTSTGAGSPLRFVSSQFGPAGYVKFTVAPVDNVKGFTWKVCHARPNLGDGDAFVRYGLENRSAPPESSDACFDQQDQFIVGIPAC